MLVETYPQNILKDCINQTLEKAGKEKDYMWVAGIYRLVKKMGIDTQISAAASAFKLERAKKLYEE